MTVKELKYKFIEFFKERGHRVSPNESLIPKNDASTLFISAGMQPLTPYLLGKPHPLGKRLVSLQRCLRTTDIEKVGDESHHSFFEMLGNWSLGDYFKKEALAWSLEFVTQVLRLPQESLSVTIFAGDESAPFDHESEAVWLELGIPKERIYPLGREDNWWEGGGETAPGGPDSEIFYDTGRKPCGPGCQPGDNCGRFVEIWNNVFMEYQKKLKAKAREYVRLPQRNVDTGLGVERTLAILQGNSDDYQTELFSPLISEIANVFGKNYSEPENKKAFRVMADHLRAATFLLAEGVVPSNLDRGYILRRLVRRAIRFGHSLGEKGYFTAQIGDKVIAVYQEEYPHLLGQKDLILSSLEKEEAVFGKTLDHGLKEVEKLLEKTSQIDKKAAVSGQEAFRLYESFGFPLEMTQELASEKGLTVDLEEFNQAKSKHQAVSRQGAQKKFYETTLCL